jgi:hypothetical protein
MPFLRVGVFEQLVSGAFVNDDGYLVVEDVRMVKVRAFLLRCAFPFWLTDA